MSVIMADLDLLREINNTYGHLAGDAVLKGVAEIFRAAPGVRRPGALRRRGVRDPAAGDLAGARARDCGANSPARSERRFEIETSSEPIRASVSLGVAGFPKDGTNVNELIHQADLAVYRAKLQGRNRALNASSEPLLIPAERSARLASVPRTRTSGRLPRGRCRRPRRPSAARRKIRRHITAGPRFLALSPTLTAVVALVSATGIGLGFAALLSGGHGDLAGLLAVVVAVGAGQALALELEGGSISVSAVGALAGVALFGPGRPLPLALTMAVVAWSAEPSRSLLRLLQRRRAVARVADRSRWPSRSARASRSPGSVRSSRRSQASGRAVPTSSSTRASSRAPWRSRATTAGETSGTSGSPGSCRTTWPSAPWAGRSRSRTRRSASTASRSSSYRSCSCGRRWRRTCSTRSGAPQAPRGGRDDPLAEREPGAGEPPPAGALDGGDGEPLGHGRRARRLHGRALAPRSAPRARDRPRARALAAGARPPRPRGALPRHRQARGPGRGPPEAGDADGRRVGR